MLRNTFLSILLASTSVAQTTWYVQGDGTPAGSGTQASPFGSIQQAIDAASSNDAIVVLPGTYLERIDYGAKLLRIESTGGYSATVIDGQSLGTVVNLNGSGSELVGFGVRNGLGSSWTEPGGISSSSSTTIQSCAVYGNVGGAASARTGGTGGIAGSGTIIDSRITGNDGGDPGGTGGVDGDFTIVRCVIHGNGGGDENLLIGGGVGGVRGYLHIVSCVVSYNDAGLNTTPWPAPRVAGAHLFASSSVYNCTVMDNWCSGSGDPGDIPGIHFETDGVVRNSIVYFNRRGSSPQGQISGATSVSYSCVEGGHMGAGNFSSDPLVYYDYRLTSISPCIDAGSDAAVSGLHPWKLSGDFEGNPRFIGPIDMGAHEYVDSPALDFLVQPSDALIHQTIQPAIEIEARDALGRAIPGWVHVQLDNAPPGVNLLGTTVVQVSSLGLAVFDDFSVDTAGSNYRLRATQDVYGGLSRTSSSFNILNPTPSLASIDPPFLVAGSGSQTITLTGSDFVSDPVVLWDGTPLSTAHVSGSTLQATVGAVQTATSGTVLVTVENPTPGGGPSNALSYEVKAYGDPYQLAFAQVPHRTVSGASITPAIEVEMQDAWGNRVLNAANFVTMHLQSSTPGATLSGTVTRRMVDSVATFPDLSVDRIGWRYRLSATCPGMQSTLSTTFDIQGVETARPLYVYQGDDSGEGLGICVAAAGDANADTYPDFLIGCSDDLNPSGQRRGSVSLHSGIDGSQIFVIYSDAAGDEFAAALDGVGDINHDGHDDFLVGAPDASSGDGQAILYSGLDGSPLHTFTAPGLQGRLGEAVAGIGDLNGDGFDDMLVGLPFQDANGSDSGRAVVFTGGTWTILHDLAGSGAGHQFGSAVADVGDVDGDTVADFAVGVPDGLDSSGIRTGIVQVFSGASGLELYRVEGTVGGRFCPRFGAAVAGAGDVNADGAPDLIVGSPKHFVTLGVAIGMVTMWSGVDGAPLWSVLGSSGASELGTAVSGFEDLNRDGRPDVLVGAPEYVGTQGTIGAAFVLCGATGQALRVVEGPADGDRCGAAVSAVGDLNRDGWPEFVVAAPQHDVSSGDEGMVTIQSGFPFQVARTYYQGDGCWSSEYEPFLLTSSNPVLGQTMTFHVRDAPHSTIGALVMSPRPMAPIPLVTGPPGSTGICMLHLRVPWFTLTSLMTSPPGIWSWPLAIPFEPFLAGAPLNFQAILLPPPAGIGLTNGLATVLGH